MIRAALPPLLGALILALVIMLPVNPKLAPFPPVELPLILCLLCLPVGWIRIVMTLLLGLLAVQKLADLAMQSALGRGFNAVADLSLIGAAGQLIGGSFGVPALIVAILGLLGGAALLLGLIWWAAGIGASGIWSRANRLGPIMRSTTLAGAVLLFGVLAGMTGAPNMHYAAGKLDLAQRTLVGLREFRHAAATDPFAGRKDLLGAIPGDVWVIFVESYGRSSFDTPFYAQHHLPRLHAAEAALTRAGLAMRSGFLVAPTQGGQSWLSHATLANGLWVADQASYQAVLASRRRSLFHHAQTAGFRTVALMPAITRPWPEARAMGFGQVLAASDLAYRGKPFNWVTMPDQYTLAQIDRRLPGDARNFVQVALISSHAPWVPVPSMVPWDQIGDGTIFDAMAMAGDTPAVVWRDRDRVKAQYRDSIDYALQAVFEHIARHAKDPPLVLLLGDHQAAPGIAMSDSRDVALHVIGAPGLVEQVAGWGFTPGLVPEKGSPAIPMDRIRDLMLTTFSPPAE